MNARVFPPRWGHAIPPWLTVMRLKATCPQQDIKRFLKERPRAIGLTAPGMPHGSPGMEGARSDPYDVLLINKQGDTTVYSRHLPSDPKESMMRLK